MTAAGAKQKNRRTALAIVNEQKCPLFVAACILITSTSSASAYIDPGTGSIILQAIAGAAIAIGLFWRRLVNRVREWLGPTKANEKPKPPGPRKD